MKKQPKENKPPEGYVAGIERFTTTCDVKNVSSYPLHSIHDFEGVKYKVVAIMGLGNKYSIELVRV
jgi:hypothetical protein